MLDLLALAFRFFLCSRYPTEDGIKNSSDKHFRRNIENSNENNRLTCVTIMTY